MLSCLEITSEERARTNQRTERERKKHHDVIDSNGVTVNSTRERKSANDIASKALSSHVRCYFCVVLQCAHMRRIQRLFAVEINILIYDEDRRVLAASRGSRAED